MSKFPEETSSTQGVPSVEQNERPHGGPGEPGSSEADFLAAWDRHAPELLRYAIRCTGRREIAEELTSEAFLKMYQNRSNVNPSQAGAWLMATLKNLARDRWRHAAVERRNANPPPLLSFPSREPPPWDELMRHPALKPEHRVCLTLRYVHGMDRKEIMSHTGLSDNQIKNCLQYGLKLLREEYGAKE